jgi:hypothetical protein
VSIHWERHPSKAAEVIALRCDVCHRTWTEENHVDDIEYYGRELLANEFRARWGLVEVGKDVGGNVDRCGSCAPKSIFGGTAQTLQLIRKEHRVDAAANPHVSSSWDVRDGEVRENAWSERDVAMGPRGRIEYVGDGWLKTPAQHRAERARARAIEREKRNASALLLQKLAAQTTSQAEQWRQYERDRFRAAMQGMANVMACVVRAFANQDQQVAAFAKRQRETRGYGPDWPQHVRTEWSRRVREGVAKLQPPGPRVYCASEEDI